MTHAQIDDGYPDHPKIAVLSDAAFRAHASSICYCSKYLTDGLIPRTVGIRLAQNKRSALGELTAGDPPLWIEVEGGFRVRDFLEWNRSRAEVEEYRSKKQAAGKAGARARASSSVEASESAPVLLGEERLSVAVEKQGVVRRDEEFEAMAEGWMRRPYRDLSLPRQVRGRIAEALGQIRQVGHFQPSEIAARWEAAWAWHPDWEWTPQTFVGYWDRLAAGAPRGSGQRTSPAQAIAARAAALEAQGR